MSKELVNHPSHYNIEGKKECIVEMEERLGIIETFNFCVGNAYKYRYRAGNKEGNSAEQDLKKAEWYTNYALKLWDKVRDNLLKSLDEYKLGSFTK